VTCTTPSTGGVCPSSATALTPSWRLSRTRHLRILARAFPGPDPAGPEGPLARPISTPPARFASILHPSREKSSSPSGFTSRSLARRPSFPFLRIKHSWKRSPVSPETSTPAPPFPRTRRKERSPSTLLSVAAAPLSRIPVPEHLTMETFLRAGLPGPAWKPRDTRFSPSSMIPVTRVWAEPRIPRRGPEEGPPLIFVTYLTGSLSAGSMEGPNPPARAAPAGRKRPPWIVPSPTKRVQGMGTRGRASRTDPKARAGVKPSRLGALFPGFTYRTGAGVKERATRSLSRKPEESLALTVTQ